MTEKPDSGYEDVKDVERKKEQEQTWYDPLVKVVQEFLDFNMIKYTKERTPRL